MKHAVIIAAGGMGKRFGRSTGKQLYEYEGRPIVIRTIGRFVGIVDQIIVVIKEEDKDKLKQYLDEAGLTVDAIISSGPERYDSVRNGLAVVRENIDNVLVHDGVRPNISQVLLERIKRALVEHEAVIPVIPVTDTIKVVKNDQVVTTPKSEELFQVQTPQAFRTKLLKSAYAKVDPAGCTDDAMVVENFGKTVYTVIGDRDNVKITTPEDVKYIRTY